MLRLAESQRTLASVATYLGAAAPPARRVLDGGRDGGDDHDHDHDHGGGGGGAQDTSGLQSTAQEALETVARFLGSLRTTRQLLCSG